MSSTNKTNRSAPNEGNGIYTKAGTLRDFTISLSQLCMAWMPISMLLFNHMSFFDPRKQPELSPIPLRIKQPH